MRTLVNKDGVIFDAEKNYVFFAEDWNEVTGKITNLESSNAQKANSNEVVKINGNQTINDIKTFGTNAEISNPRINVFGYSNTVPLQLWGDDSGQVGSYMRRLQNNVMQFVAKNFGGLAHEFLGFFKFKNGLDVEGDYLNVKTIELKIQKNKNEQRRITFNNNSDANQMIIYQPANSDDLRIYNTLTSEDVITIKANSNVGIGTSNPLRKFEVNGGMRFTNGSSDVNDGVLGSAVFGAGLNIVGINTDSTHRKVSLWGNIVYKESFVPSSSNAQGEAGEMAYDGNYIYRCVATNTWKRTPLSTW